MSDARVGARSKYMGRPGREYPGGQVTIAEPHTQVCQYD